MVGGGRAEILPGHIKISSFQTMDYQRFLLLRLEIGRDETISGQDQKGACPEIRVMLGWFPRNQAVTGMMVISTRRFAAGFEEIGLLSPYPKVLILAGFTPCCTRAFFTASALRMDSF